MSIVTMNHAHLFCSSGGAGIGFNMSNPRAGGLQGEWRCIGGIDVDPGRCRDFRNFTGAPATVMDLFNRPQYLAHNGHEPPAGWREALPEDIRRAFGHQHPTAVVTSPPCRGFSGLLSAALSLTAKYQALNELTLRGLWLLLEAYADDPVEFICLENVPLLKHRGDHLLEQMVQLLRRFGYATAETVHDCGEIGGLAQSRKRFLMMARHTEKIPPFLYQPDVKPLRAVGDVLGRMLLPGDMRAGPMHRVPKLQWKTWTRLAMVTAGSDWRSLNRLAVVDGKLRDYLILPDGFCVDDATSLQVPDLRYAEELRRGPLGVVRWESAAGTIAGENRATNGAFNVADPRFQHSDRWNAGQQYGVHRWDEACGTVTGQQSPGQGRFAVADPRHMGPPKHLNEFRVTRWNAPAGVVSGAHGTGQCISDPRVGGERHANVYRVVCRQQHSGTTLTADFKATSGDGVADSQAAAAGFGKYEVTDWHQPARTVIGASTTGQGAFAVADPRPPQQGKLFSKYPVCRRDGASGTVIGGDDTGAYAVADPRPGMRKEAGDSYLTGGHYGVVPWSSSSGAVPASACHDNGHWSVADPRDQGEPNDGTGCNAARINVPSLPAANDRLVAIIRAEDGTWHRPFTTLDLAALQSLYDPDEWRELEEKNAWRAGRLVGAGGAEPTHFRMDGSSDTAYRERIGDMIPPQAAKAVATVIGETFLLAKAGETFILSAQPVWVRPLARALTLPNGGAF
jgi:site-specific DNA-cytosine methylase